MNLTEYVPPRQFWAIKETYPYLFQVTVVKETDKVLWMPGKRALVRKHKRALRTFESFADAREALIEDANAVYSKRIAEIQTIDIGACTR